jgi:hypothetical protein
LPIRLSLLTVSVALLLLGPSIGAAQTASFRELALRVNLEDRLKVEDLSGVTTTGRLVGLTGTEIVLETHAGKRRFGPNVASIAVRPHAMREVVLIGAGLGALGGLVAACSRAEREECGDAALILGAAGAGAGVVVGALRPGWRTVYSAGRAATQATSAGPPGPLDELALHVNLGDWLRVRDRSGATISGRLTRLAGDEIALETKSGEARVAGTDVRTVAVRGYALGRGALIGAAAFTALAFAAPACRDNPDCVPLVAAPFGAGVGLAIGALVPQMKTVFRAQAQRVSVAPVISPRSIGVRAILRW